MRQMNNTDEAEIEMSCYPKKPDEEEQQEIDSLQKNVTRNHNNYQIEDEKTAESVDFDSEIKPEKKGPLDI